MLELPKGVMVPTAADFTALQTWAPLMGQSVDELLPYRWNSQVEMDATVPTEPGQYGFRLDEDMRMYRWDNALSDWLPVLSNSGRLVFDTVAQMNAHPVYEGYLAYAIETGLEYIGKTGVWKSYTLPPPKKNSVGTTVINISQTSWGRLNGLGAIEYNLDRPMYCEISLNAWLESNNSGVRAGLQVVGDNISLAPPDTNMPGTPTSSNTSNWGAVIRTTNQAGQREGSRVVVMQPGYNEISAWAYREASTGTQQVNYASIWAKPLGWAD